VAELQEALGAYNDAATSQSFIENLGLPADGDTQFASGYPVLFCAMLNRKTG
jgi:hypothetical protein